MNSIYLSKQSHSKGSAVIIPFALLAVTSLSHAVTSANLLVDHGYEAQATLPTLASVVTNFSSTQGIWGAENGSFVGADGGVTPLVSRMLKMVDDGGVTTQTIQMIDLFAFASQIATGTATFNMSALFNTSATSGTPSAGINTLFFASATSWGSPIGSGVTNTLALDTNPGTWQQISGGGAIPVGAGWAGFQVFFGNANLNGEFGYVDASPNLDRPTGFTVTTVPEPPGTMLLGLSASLLLLRRRK